MRIGLHVEIASISPPFLPDSWAENGRRGSPTKYIFPSFACVKTFFDVDFKILYFPHKKVMTVNQVLEQPKPGSIILMRSKCESPDI
jgi:hypothetical protein